MKRFVCILCILAIILSAVPAVAVEGAFDFIDIEAGRYYCDGVEYCVDNGLMVGVSEYEFAPNDSMNRAMFVTVLWRMAGEPAPAEGFEGHDFVDGGRYLYYEKAVNWAVSYDIVNGISDTSFGPYVDITREMMCALMVRYAFHMGYDVYSSIGADMTTTWYMVDAMFAEVEASLFPDNTAPFVFADTIEISNYALAPVYSCYDMGVINGVSEFEFDPKGTATRGQVATVLQRFLYNVAYETTSVTEGYVTTDTYTDPYGNVVGTTVVTEDEDGNILSIVFTEGDYTDTVTYTYDEEGNILSDTYENSDGVFVVTTYDPETGDVMCDYGDGTKYAYTYGENGVATVIGTVESEEEGYSYKSETKYTYSYDDIGNLTGMTVDEYSYINYDGEESESTSTGKVTFNYDTNGNGTGFTMSIPNEEGVYEEMISVEYDADRTRYDMTMTMLGETITIEFSKAHNAVVVTAGGETMAMTLEEYFSVAY